jgi:hypothetical protein
MTLCLNSDFDTKLDGTRVSLLTEGPGGIVLTLNLQNMFYKQEYLTFTKLPKCGK